MEIKIVQFLFAPYHSVWKDKIFGLGNNGVVYYYCEFHKKWVVANYKTLSQKDNDKK